MADNYYKLPSSNRISYGGYEFSELVKTSVNVTPVMNTANTTIKYLRQEFTIEAIVGSYGTTMNTSNAADEFRDYSTSWNPRRASPAAVDCAVDSADIELESIKATLLTPQLNFVFNGRGYGKRESYEVTDNQDSSRNQKVRDVLFGPMPKMLSWEPIAGNKFARVVWKVEIHRRPSCPQTRITGLNVPIVELWTTTRVSIGSSGYQTIVREGSIEIPAHNTYSKKLKGGKLIDKYRDIVRMYILGDPKGWGLQYVGFNISSQEYKFSPDLLTCNFTITFKEIESQNPYPPGVQDIDVRHRLRSELYGSKWQKNFQNWKNDFSARIVLFPKEPGIRAWTTFTRLINERIEQSIEIVDDGPNRIVRIPLILSMSMEESLFSHEYKFDVSWTIVSPPATLFERSGLFKPAFGTNVPDDQAWQEWTATARMVQNTYGAYPMVAHKDITVNLGWCGSTSKNTLEEWSAYGYSTRGFSAAFLQSIYNFVCPPEEASYIEFQNSFQLDTSANLINWSKYRTDTVRKEENVEKDKKRKVEISSLNDQGQKETDYVEQDMGRDAYAITMRGYAIRMGGPTQPPVIKKVGGKKVRPENNKSNPDFVNSSMTGQYGNCPIYLTTWQKRYVILGYPEGDTTENTETNGSPSNY